MRNFASLLALVVLCATALWFWPRTVYELWTPLELTSGTALSRRAPSRVVVKDANADGWPDIWVVSDADPGSSGRAAVRLYYNRGGREFVAAEAVERGVPLPSVPGFSDSLLNHFGACSTSHLGPLLPRGHRGVLFDADNDGAVDIFTFGAATRSARPRFLLGGAKQSFTDVARRVHPLLSKPIEVIDATAADLDGDARLDLVVLVPGEPPQILWNGFAPRPSLALVIEPRPASSDGTEARTITESIVQCQVVTPAGGIREYCITIAADRTADVHLGLGDGAGRVELRIRWPGGAETSFAHVTPGRYRLTETSAGLIPAPLPPRSSTEN